MFISITMAVRGGLRRSIDVIFRERSRREKPPTRKKPLANVHRHQIGEKKMRGRSLVQRRRRCRRESIDTTGWAGKSEGARELKVVNVQSEHIVDDDEGALGHGLEMEELREGVGRIRIHF